MTPTTTIEANKDRVRRMLEEVWNAGQPERLSAFWDPASVDEARDVHTMLTTGFPDLRISVEDVVAEGDRVVVRLVFRGTHDGPFRGMEPTGRPVEFGAIRIYQLVDGLVVDTWAYQDSVGLVQQLRGSSS